MKVLWITNILFPEAIDILTGKGELKSTGGWLIGASQALLKNKDVHLCVATVSDLVSKITKLEGERISYYILPLGRGNTKFNDEYLPLWKHIQKEYNPDIVHIHGTEFSHGNAYLKACGNRNVVVSIQGLVSGIAPFYRAGLSKVDILKNITFRDCILGTILRDQTRFYQRGEIEIDTIVNSKYIIGRTSWDYAKTWAINPKIKYFFCNETLRSDFYDGSVWEYDKCVPHSIFLSQGGYPLKGLHQVLKAMPFILRQYPDTIIRIAGLDITKNHSFSEIIRFSGYGLYIKRLISKLRLVDHVTFTGNLSAEDMKKEYLRSNVFICPSAIENSPNSLGEAQILGVPCIASFVGGVPDMMDGNHYLYRFEEFEMLAKLVCDVFAEKNKYKGVRDIAYQRHNPIENSKQLYGIYTDILHML